MQEGHGAQAFPGCPLHSLGHAFPALPALLQQPSSLLMHFISGTRGRGWQGLKNYFAFLSAEPHIKIVHISAQRFIPHLPFFMQHWQVVPFPSRLTKLVSCWLVSYSLHPVFPLPQRPPGASPRPPTSSCWTKGSTCCEVLEPRTLHGEAAAHPQSLFVPPLWPTTFTKLGTTPCLLKRCASVGFAQVASRLQNYTWGRRNRQPRKTE